jgi:hypothetical protein
MNETTPTYCHTQSAPWFLLLYGLAVVILVAAPKAHPEFLHAVFVATGLFMFLLGASLQRLSVEDEGNQLAVRFGPLPLFRRRIWYDDIREVSKGKVGFHDCWGVHWSPWSGWIFSIRGRDCVVVRLRRGTVRIGTDDADGLLRFLKSRMPRMSE